MVSISTHIDQLAEALGVEKPLRNEAEKRITFTLNDEITLYLKEEEVGGYISANLRPLPKKKESLEELWIALSSANLFNQATAGGVIGIDPQEKFLTLSLAIEYEVRYPLFRDMIEDFVNYYTFWRKKIDEILAKEQSNPYL